jgi:predicted Zn-dependent protease
MSRVLLSMFLLFFITACATSPEGRTQLMAPAPLQGFSAVYSEFDMRLQLVTAADSPACQEAECVADRAFDQRILALGRRLADAAFRQHAELYLRLPRFEFIVADKAEPGAASSAGGTVIIYRGLQRMNLDDAVLAFALAREMSHVIAGHHDENVAASILVAVAAQILFPVLNIGGLFAGGAATAAAGSAAGTTVGTTAVTSAASFLGSRAVRASYRPQQEREAEIMAMKLLAAAGWEGIEVGEKLESLRPHLPGETTWTLDLRESALRVASLMQRPPLPDPDDARSQIVSGFPFDLPPPMVSRPF